MRGSRRWRGSAAPPGSTSTRHFFDPETGGIREELSNDELHLLGPGYALWKQQIETRCARGRRARAEVPGDEEEDDAEAPPDERAPEETI